LTRRLFTFRDIFDDYKYGMIKVNFRKAKDLAIQFYILPCIAVSLISALDCGSYDPRIFWLFGICLLLRFWRTSVYILSLIVILLLAFGDVVHMFPELHVARFGIGSGESEIHTPYMDLRVLWFLIPFLMLVYPRLKKRLLSWLNSGEE